MSGGAVSWCSKKQTNVALSTAEAEYVALSSAVQEAIWLRQLNSKLNHPPSNPTVIYEDNQSAIAMTNNPKFHGRHWYQISFCSWAGSRWKSWTQIEKMIADILTKGLSQDQFKRLRNMMGVQELQSEKWEGVLKMHLHSLVAWTLTSYPVNTYICCKQNFSWAF